MANGERKHSIILLPFTICKRKVEKGLTRTRKIVKAIITVLFLAPISVPSTQ
jgi:hypothetical protein